MATRRRLNVKSPAHLAEPRLVAVAAPGGEEQQREEEHEDRGREAAHAAEEGEEEAEEEEEEAAPAAGSAAPAPLPEEPAVAPGVLVAADGGAAGGSIARAVTGGSAPAVRQRARVWAELCGRDPQGAALEALNATLELAGFPGDLKPEDLDEDPRGFMASLPDVARELKLDVASYPLLPSVRNGKRSASNFERFWSMGIGDQNAVALLESGLLALLSRWLLVFPQAAVRSLRHASTIAALAMAGGLGHHHQSLRRAHDTSQRQLEAAGAGHNARQVAQMKRDAESLKANAQEVHNVRTQLLETLVPARSRDVSDVIRLYTLTETDRLMKQDAEMFVQNKWTARVFLMIHDPNVEVRLKAISIIYQWYATTWKRSDAMKEHLTGFAQRCLSHLVERVGDIEASVAKAALRCLRLPVLAHQLQDEEFDMIVNLCVGSQDLQVREEAALFINAHVFQDPGICVPATLAAKRQPSREADVPGGGAGDGVAGAVARAKADVVKDLYNSETCISMLVEYLENYMSDQLRITDRLVSAFWGRAPALTHWSTMLNLCLVGEGQQTASVDPMRPQQRLALLYIIEAAVRKADEDFRSVKAAEQEAAAVKLSDACAHFLPEMPRLLDLCRPEEQQALLLSHVCKILLEYAMESAHNQALIRCAPTCASLRRAIEGRAPPDTTKYCVDSLLALARFFGEARETFLDICKTVHGSCMELLRPEVLAERAEDARAAMNLFVILSNRGMEVTFGKVDMFARMLALLRTRSRWMVGRHSGADVGAGDSQANGGGGAAGAAAATPFRDLQEPPRPPDIPDARLTLQLLEAATTTVLWHVRMAVWDVDSRQPGGGDQEDAVESHVSQMIQGLAESSANRDDLAPAVAQLRQACTELISTDSSPYVRFHAYSAYMLLLQLALGVSEKISLEEPVGGQAAAPTSWAQTYPVKIPEGHMKVLWQYLNNFYICLSGADAEGLMYSSEGHRVMASDVYPAPSQNTMTSVRFLTLQCMQSESAAEGHGLDREGELLLAVLASRAVMECELEDVYAGPLGLLLLTQCERSRPKPMRDVAIDLFRKLRNMARDSTDFAVQFYRMQQEAVSGLFECASFDAASALSIAFMRHTGPRIQPWLERSFYIVLKDAALSCVSEDRRRLPLLEVFSSWFRGPMDEVRCREITSELLHRCREAGIDGEVDPHVAKFLQRAVHPFPLQDDAGRGGRRADASADDPRGPSPGGLAETPQPPQRLGGKRPLVESEAPSLDLVDDGSARKSARTVDSARGVFQ